MALNLWGEEDAQPTAEERHLAEIAFGDEAAYKRQQRKEAGNPLIALYGPGPLGALCRECGHFMRVHHHGRNYMKCNLRKLTHGAGTDHKSRWAACGKFEAGENQVYNLDMMGRD